jgi:phosphotransferase system HPr-like phosphotransfer protein
MQTIQCWIAKGLRKEIKMPVELKDANDAAKLIAICGRYDSRIDLTNGRYIVDAKSPMGVMALMPSDNLTVCLHSSNPSEYETFCHTLDKNNLLKRV